MASARETHLVQLEKLLQETGQPVIVELTHPEFNQNLASMSYPRLRLDYYNDRVLMCPQSFFRPQCNKLILMDLVTGKGSLCDINLSRNELYHYSQLSKSEFVTIDADSVKVWKLEEMKPQLLRCIPLPSELTQHFLPNSRAAYAWPLSIKMFPDGRHMGILVSDADFYLIDCVEGRCTKFALGQKCYTPSNGFVAHSANEISVCFKLAGTDWCKWYKIKLDAEKSTFIATPTEYHTLIDYKGEDYYLQPLGEFQINCVKTGDFTDLYFYLQTHLTKKLCGGRHDVKNPVYLAKLEKFCFMKDGQLHVLSPEYKKPQEVATFNELILPVNLDGILSLQRLDDRSVIITSDRSEKMKIYIFPTVKKILDKTLSFLPPGINQMISGYLNESIQSADETPAILKAQDTAITGFTVVQPLPFVFEPDLKQINSLHDVAKALEHFKNQAEKIFNQSNYQEHTACYQIAQKLGRIIQMLTIDREPKWSGLFNPDNMGAYIMRQDYQDDSLFRDPAHFAEDFLRYLKMVLPRFIGEKDNYLNAQVIPFMIQKFNLDKLAERAGEIIRAKLAEKSPPKVTGTLFTLMKTPRNNTREEDFQNRTSTRRATGWW